MALGAWVILQLAVGVVSAQTRFDFGSLPLWFEAGQGGAVPGEYTAHGRDSQITILRDGAQFVLGRTGQTAETAGMQFVGAGAGAAIAGGAEMPARINYLSGNDPSKWRSGLAAFGQVRVNGLYPGVNVVYYGNQQRLEYDFDLAPGARPESIAIRFDGRSKSSGQCAGGIGRAIGRSQHHAAPAGCLPNHRQRQASGEGGLQNGGPGHRGLCRWPLQRRACLS